MKNTSRETTDVSNSTANVIWLVGSGRSGTTWVSNLINYHGTYQYMFEPLHHFVQKNIPRRQPFLFPPSGKNTPHRQMFEQIFSGQLKHKWTDQFCSSASEYKGLLVKDIFGHMCLDWVHQWFPHVKIVFLLRHPFAVALSQMRLRWRSYNVYHYLFNDPQLYANFLYPYQNVVSLAKGTFEKHILSWAIVNRMALQQINSEQMHVAFYEDTCLNFEDEMYRLFTYLGDTTYQQEGVRGSHDSNNTQIENRCPLDPRLLEQYRTPSALARKDSAVNQGCDLVDVRKNQLTEAQKYRGDNILREFGLDNIYNSQSLTPNLKGLNDFLRRARNLENCWQQPNDESSKSGKYQFKPPTSLPISDRIVDQIWRVMGFLQFR